MSTLQENVKRLGELYYKYPKKVKMILSEGDVKSVDIDAMINNNCTIELFENADADLLNYVSKQLMAGKEVVIMPTGENKIMILAAPGLLENKY